MMEFKSILPYMKKWRIENAELRTSILMQANSESQRLSSGSNMLSSLISKNYT